MARLGGNTAAIMDAAAMYRFEEQTHEDGCCMFCGEWNAQLGKDKFCRRRDDEDCWQARLAIALVQGDKLLKAVTAGKNVKKTMATMNENIGFAQYTTGCLVWM